MDFINSVKGCNSGKVEVKQMTIQDFFLWTDCASQAKIKKIEPRLYLHDIVRISANRGKRTLTYWTDYKTVEGKDLDFLKIKEFKGGVKEPLPCKMNRGIPEEKKNAIIKNLCPLMENSRRKFWEDIDVSEVPDLNNSFE